MVQRHEYIKYTQVRLFLVVCRLLRSTRFRSLFSIFIKIRINQSHIITFVCTYHCGTVRARRGPAAAVCISAANPGME